MTVVILQTFGKKDNGSFIFILTTDQISALLTISFKSVIPAFRSEKKFKIYYIRCFTYR